MEIETPEYRLDVIQTNWAPWAPMFKRWHYLSDAGPMGFSVAYCGFIGDDAVAFLGMSAMSVGKGVREARCCRFVVLPQWQGSGIAIPFLEFLTERELRGDGFVGKPTTTIIHTAAPSLCHVLRRSPKWRQISGKLSADRAKSQGGGYGGHMRAVAGFRYFGQAGVDAWGGR